MKKTDKINEHNRKKRRNVPPVKYDVDEVLFEITVHCNTEQSVDGMELNTCC